MIIDIVIIDTTMIAVNTQYNTLNKMAYDGKYCLTDDGEPSEKWVNDISSIASKS